MMYFATLETVLDGNTSRAAHTSRLSKKANVTLAAVPGSIYLVSGCVLYVSLCGESVVCGWLGVVAVS